MKSFIIFFLITQVVITYRASSQTITDSILIEDHYRTFHFNQTQNSFHEPSLIFVMHGSGGDGIGMMKAAEKMEAKANRENAIVVYPDGYKKYWNECRKASPVEANVIDINEQSFFDGMIQYFKQKFDVNEKNVFAVGTSGGGHMAYKLALTMPDKFRAITAIIANLPDTNNMDCVLSGKPIAVMIVNGTADQTNPYNGGEVNIGFSLGFVRSTERTFHYWADLDGYKDEAPKEENLPDADPNDGKTIEKYTFKEKDKPEVTLLKVIGGKHDYPNDIDVHVEAWEFFKRQMME